MISDCDIRDNDLALDMFNDSLNPVFLEYDYTTLGEVPINLQNQSAMPHHWVVHYGEVWTDSHRGLSEHGWVERHDFLQVVKIRKSVILHPYLARCPLGKDYFSVQIPCVLKQVQVPRCIIYDVCQPIWLLEIEEVKFAVGEFVTYPHSVLIVSPTLMALVVTHYASTGCTESLECVIYQ